MELTSAMEGTLESIKKKDTEVCWHSRLQTIGIIVSLAGMVYLFFKIRNNGK